LEWHQYEVKSNPNYDWGIRISSIKPKACYFEAELNLCVEIYKCIFYYIKDLISFTKVKNEFLSNRLYE